MHHLKYWNIEYRIEKKPHKNVTTNYICFICGILINILLWKFSLQDSDAYYNYTNTICTIKL